LRSIIATQSIYLYRYNKLSLA